MFYPKFLEQCTEENEKEAKGTLKGSQNTRDADKGRTKN